MNKMKRINPNLIKLAERTFDPSYKPSSIEEKVEEKEETEVEEMEGHIYVPSIKLYVAEERSHLGKDWFDAHKGLQEQELRMLTLPEYVAFLKHLKENIKTMGAYIKKGIEKIKR